MNALEKTNMEIMQAYFPSGLLYDSLNYTQTNYYVLIFTYVYQFSLLFSYLETLLNNFLPVDGTDTTFLNLWKLVTELDDNNDLPLSLSVTAIDRQIQWNWIKYVFAKFEQITNVDSINQCLTDLDIRVTCYQYPDAPLVMRTALETENGGTFTNEHGIYVFDISFYTQSSENTGFDYDFPVDFYIGLNQTLLENFLKHLLPIYCLPLYYEGES